MTEQAAKIRSGDPRALARAATGVENRDPQALELLRELAAARGHARIVGITGPPGAGKSTLVDALAGTLRSRGKTVAILAVDPSSRSTGGAILGDRIRMQRHHADPGIFIRSMATRGSLGGLARATADLAHLMDAAGRDYVLIETVGVGQGEIEIAGLAQVTVVVLVPGMGDDVQTIKAGIMEIADVFVINKADHSGADRMETELQGMLGLGDGKSVPIVRTVATDGTGVDQLLAAIEEIHRAPGQTPVGEFAIDHIGIAVRSIEDALAFYRGQLGLELSALETVQDEKLTVARLPVGSTRLELLLPQGPDAALATFLQTNGPGLHHLALRVPDLAGSIERLRAAGAKLIEVPRNGSGGHCVFVQPASSGGVLLELIQDH